MHKSVAHDQHPWGSLSYLSGGAALLSALFLDTDIYVSTSFAVLAIILGVRVVRQFDSLKEQGRWLAICSIAIGSLAIIVNAINLIVYYLEI